jgi:nitronate monooxygenase
VDAVDFPELRHPIVQAPMGGGPGTPRLAGAVADAGGLGFLAGGYKTPAGVREEIAELRSLTSAPFGLNLFVPSSPAADAEAIARYQERLEPEAKRLGVELGAPRWDDDSWAEKLEVALEERVPIVAWTFGLPPGDAIERTHAYGTAVWITVTEPEEARDARDAGADALVVQGVEAGAHRGTWVDEDGRGAIELLPLLEDIAGEVDLPLVATGGIADRRGVTEVLAAGATAAQIGTAFMLCPEAGTSEPHRRALRDARPTEITRAFTGRRARALENRFMRENSAAAPSAYPQIHNLTAPLRTAARDRGDLDALHLWAGERYASAEAVPAAELVRRLSPR